MKEKVSTLKNIDSVFIPEKHKYSSTHKVCATCRAVKPLKDFEFKETKRQAQAYNHAKQRILESKNCAKCRPQPKPLMELSLKQIHTKMENGEITMRDYLEQPKEKRKLLGREKMRDNAKKRWHRVWEEVYTAHIQDAHAEHNRVATLLRVYIQRLRERQDNIKESTAIDYLRAYKASLHTLKKELRRLNTYLDTAPMKGYRWYDYINNEEKLELTRLYKLVVPEVRVRFSPPQFINEEN